jgi:integrase/recombinase XerC
MDAARRMLRLPAVQTNLTPAILTQGEAARVQELANVGSGERAMVTVLLGAGLRVAELCGLDASDVVALPSALWALRIRGKRSKDRVVPVHQPVITAILEYLAATGRSALEGPLFLAHDRGAKRRTSQRITTGSARRRINALLRAAGVTKAVRVHGFRHTYAVAVLEQSRDLNAVRRLLGHASLTTTQRYIDHVDLAGLLRAVPRSFSGTAQPAQSET